MTKRDWRPYGYSVSTVGPRKQVHSKEASEKARGMIAMSHPDAFRYLERKEGKLCRSEDHECLVCPCRFVEVITEESAKKDSGHEDILKIVRGSGQFSQLGIAFQGLGFAMRNGDRPIMVVIGPNNMAAENCLSQITRSQNRGNAVPEKTA